MSLKEKIDSAIKDAMKAKDQGALTALRGVKSMILLAQTEKGAVEELAEDAEMRILQKAVKQRRESYATFISAGRTDLAEKEKAEADIIESFLPKPMSDDEVKAIIADAIKQTGATTMKDMGKVMGIATKKLAGKAEPTKVAELVKSLLS